MLILRHRERFIGLIAMMSLLFKQSILVDPSKPYRSDLFIIFQEKIRRIVNRNRTRTPRGKLRLAKDR